MQSSPLLVAKTSPVNKTNSANNQAPSQKPSSAFDHVLAKRVSQHEAESKEASKAQTNKSEAKAPRNDLTDTGDKLDEATITGKQTEKTPVDAAGALLESLAGNGLVNGDDISSATDAQALAMEATSKTLQEVTDGKVNIEPLATAPASSPLMAAAQNTIQSVATDVDSIAVDADGLEALEKPVMDVGKEAIVDHSSDTVGEKVQDKALQSNPLKETAEKLNPKFASLLAADGKQQSAAESPSDANSKITTDMAAMPLQATATKSAALASSNLASSPLAGASNLINAAPGKSGWNDAISQKMVWMVGATEQSATLTLNPKDLGPLQVIINVNNEKADATFISENPEVRKALEEGMSSLRNALGQAGVELGQANVNTNKQQQDFQQANKEYAAKQSGQSHSASGEEQGAHQPINMRVSNGLVDTFV